VLVNGQRIAALLPTIERPSGVRVIDGRGRILYPGFVDLQLYGGGGSAFGLAPSRAAQMQLRRHTLRHGTTTDGRHCAYANIRISHRLLGPRLFLISDATATTSIGPYRFRGQDDYFVDEQGRLAGSGLTLFKPYATACST
jgi:N-acetylglucosamine-6-phosphate deacetylase